MTGHLPFKKPKRDPEASSSRTKYKSPPPKKQRDMPYLNIAMARAMYRDNASVEMCDVHLPGSLVVRS
jgi:hypothetical protein